MTPDNSFVTSESGTFGGAEVFVQPREVYAVYFPDASDTGELDLSSEPGFWTLRWFNPRTDVFEGDATTLVAGAPVELPAPPSDAGEDWAALVELDRPCPPDANADGTLDPADFNAWVIAFNTQAPACDQNGDDLCDPSDFNAWVANFNAGCP
ncbi:MAG: GC-type dockerin domain-anchored protein [Planctomycetota bacterium]